MPRTRLLLRPGALEVVLPLVVPYLGSPVDGDWTIHGVIELDEYAIRVHYASPSGESFAITTVLRDHEGTPNIVPWAVVEVLRASVSLYRGGEHRTLETNEYASALLDGTAVYRALIDGRAVAQRVLPADAAAQTIRNLVAFPALPASTAEAGAGSRAAFIHGFLGIGTATRIYLQPAGSAFVVGLDVDATPQRLGWYVDVEIRNLVDDPRADETLAPTSTPTGDAYCQWAVNYTVGL